MITANKFWIALFVLILLYSLNLCTPVSAFGGQRVECPSCIYSIPEDYIYPNGWSYKWDPTSDDEIESGCTAYVSVIDGVSPYKWSVSGTGFWLSSDQTEGLSNTLNADDTACGSATITVTDNFGDKVKGYVRCQNGRWIYVGGLSCPDDGGGCHYCHQLCTSDYYIEGKFAATVMSTVPFQCDCGTTGCCDLSPCGVNQSACPDDPELCEGDTFIGSGWGACYEWQCPE